MLMSIIRTNILAKSLTPNNLRDSRMDEDDMGRLVESVPKRKPKRPKRPNAKRTKRGQTKRSTRKYLNILDVRFAKYLK